MKVVIELPLEHHASLLKYANENSPAFSMLQNGVKLSRSNKGVQTDVVVVLCDEEQAKMLRQSAAHFCLAAVPEIDKAIRLARFVIP
jgi:hypothetical protein